MASLENFSELSDSTIMHNLCFGILTIDSKGIIHYLNAYAEELVGLAAHEVIGRHVHMIFPNLDIYSIALDTPSITTELTVRHKDGNCLTVQTMLHPFWHNRAVYYTAAFSEAKCNRSQNEVLTTSPIRAGEDKLIDFTAVDRVDKDIIERKRVEEALRESEKRYRLIAENMSDVVTVLNVRGEIEYISPSCTYLFGISPEAFLGNYIYSYIHPDYERHVKEHFQKMAFTGAPFQTEYPQRHSDGHYLIVETRGMPILGHDGNVENMVMVIRDITERKHTEDLLRYSDKLSVIGEMAAGIAHEIRNPLTALRGFIQLMQVYGNNQDYTQIMLSELDRINFIVSELLVLAKPQAVQFRNKQIKPLLYDVVTLLETQAIMSGVQIQTEFMPDDSYVNCEENQLKQVFINILKNAIEAMPNGGCVQIKTKWIDDSKISISFIDEGSGIPEEQIPKLGEPFYTTKDQGTGLGLMVSYKIVRDHGGKIEITSQKNIGTAVTVTLPASIT